MKKILKIIGGIILLFVIIIIYISYVTDHNNQELESLKKEVSEKYKLNEEITYSNQYGNYYIIKTKTKVIVLSKDYKEILKEDLSKLANNLTDTSLVYKTNKLMYEKTIRTKKQITYEYYDANSGKIINKVVLEQQ